MKRRRTAVGLATVFFTFTMSSVAVAQEAPPEQPITTTTSEPQPTVTIKVEDVPADAPDTSVSHDAPTTEATDPTPSQPSTTAEPPTSVDDSPVTAVSATTVAEAVAPTTTSNPVQISAEQEAVVTGTQVAQGNSGGNATHSDPGTPGVAPPNSIDTGGATAVGSDDTNIVDQQAQVVLTEQAVANLLQVALILNIGAALANSGANDVVGAAGNGITGAIDTGSAKAVGNDMEQYITQAARATGDENTDDAAKQLAVSLWMGLGLANSGVNSITGTGSAGSGGEVGSGDATAIGNQSLTDILQQAALTGSGTSQINVAQYATVMNMGFALANSGVNDIAGVAGGLLTAGDSDAQNQLAMDLFSMLLPALMSSYGATSGAGTIGTGNATAIGNQSETYIHQLAEAAASGDGIASIIQDVLVANVGAAGANTGGNVLGGRYANLDPGSAKAVVTLAAFLSQMLALVHTQSASNALAMQEAGLDVPFGDIVLQIKGQLQGYDTTITNESGARANIRQVTIVLSLGIAQANSGLNTAQNRAVDQTNALRAGVSTSPEYIGTGNVEGINQGLVIICQRRNAADIECLAPPEPEVPTTPEEPTTTTTVPPGGPTTTVPDTRVTTPSPGDSSTHGDGPQGFGSPSGHPATATPRTGNLPATGSDPMGIIIMGFGLVMTGAFAMVLVRRRPQIRH